MLATTNLHTVTGALTPKAPFDFAKTHSFLRGFSPTAGEQRFNSGSVTKAVTINGRAVAFEVSSAGTVEEPRLAYTLFSERPLSEAEHAAVADRIGFFLSLDDNLRPFYALGRADATPAKFHSTSAAKSSTCSDNSHKA